MNRQGLAKIIAFIMLCAALAADAAAQPGPVCVGFNPEAEKWGADALPNPPNWFYCPPHYAFFGITNPPGHHRDAQVDVIGNCCPLPEPDILTDNHISADHSCPPAHVVTGFYFDGRLGQPLPGAVRPLRCTRINEAKYALGPPAAGAQWGSASSAAFPWRERLRLRPDEIPLAIRFGISREDRKSFINTGCVGHPVGSLLVRKEYSRCQGFFWSQLFVRSGEQLRPLKIFPDCIAINNVFDPEARCEKWQGAEGSE